MRAPLALARAARRAIEGAPPGADPRALAARAVLSAIHNRPELEDEAAACVARLATEDALIELAGSGGRQ